ncbi:MAG TPA: pyridoxamine 5'-phosphate oxidase family protein [Stenomitos sp.]
MAEKIQLDALYERLKHFRTAMLTTVSPQGDIHSRPMMTQEREPDADLWFVSSLNADHVREIQAHSKVGVIYFHDSDNSYVSLAGDARVVTDREFLRSRWHEDWRAWFPEGPDQADLCMIKVEPHEAEYWEPRGGRIRVMFELARGKLTGTHPEINPPVRGEIR